ncbi:hypothetical protein RCO48_33010 [Peribacillus frigoritolerans]|nr:hypothetical protein [Peribacillus frigoritolerans]
MNFNIPDETLEIINGVKQFIDKKVIPLEEENAGLLYNERNYYLEDGRRHPKSRGIEKRSKKSICGSGFYTMFGDKELGGEELGPITALLVQEAISKKLPQ